MKNSWKALQALIVSALVLAMAAVGHGQTLDTAFDANVGPVVPAATTIYATAVQPDGKVVIGGIFSSILGVARNNIARLNANGTLDTTFNPNANDQVDCIAVQADGKILVGGAFTSIGGQARPSIARLDATTGAADTAFNANAPGTSGDIVYSIAVQSDGNIVVAGIFTSMGGQPRNNVARLSSTGTADSSFNPNASGTVRALAIQRDGKILIGGIFTTVGGTARNRIARFNSDGTLDSFDPNVSNSTVRSFAIQADGKILVVGQFTGTIGGQARVRVARLDPNTGLADSFSPTAGQAVYTLAVQADGKVLLGGIFPSLTPNGGATVTRSRVARVNPDGTADAFDPNADDIVNGVTLLADGKVLVGGQFVSIGGGARNYLARLNNDTAATQSLAATQSSVTWTRGGSSVQFNRVTFESSTDAVNYSALGAGTPSGSDWTLTGLSLPAGQAISIRARGYYRSGYHGGSESSQQLVQSFTFASPPTSFSAQTPPSTGDVGLTYAGYAFVANGVPAPTYALQAGTLPGGLSLTSAGVLSGSPTASGTFSGIVVRATNVAGTFDTAPFAITIAPAVTVSPATMPDWTVNKSGYSQTFVGSNGTGAKTLSVSAGAVPTGLTFVAATGVLSGTPTATGTFNFTLRATDTLGQFATQPYTVLINPAVSVSNPTLPDAPVNLPYLQTVSATGGTGAKSFAVTVGSLPVGLSLASGGTLNGTPTVANTFNFTITAADAVGATGSKAYTVVIGAPPTITLNPTSPPDTSGAVVTFIAAAVGSPTPTVQWQSSRDGAVFTDIPGATSTTLTVNTASVRNIYQYRAVFSNAGGTATTTATLPPRRR